MVHGLSELHMQTSLPTPPLHLAFGTTLHMSTSGKCYDSYHLNNFLRALLSHRAG
jgi:hypothetical protein